MTYHFIKQLELTIWDPEKWRVSQGSCKNGISACVLFHLVLVLDWLNILNGVIWIRKIYTIDINLLEIETLLLLTATKLQKEKTTEINKGKAHGDMLYKLKLYANWGTISCSNPFHSHVKLHPLFLCPTVHVPLLFK